MKPLPPPPRRLLVIDDSALVRTWVQLQLGERYEVTEADCGEEGLRQIAADAPDVVLCDLNMPGISGLEVVRRLHADAPALPVIIYTDEQQVPVAVEALRLGACGFVVKSDELAPLLRELDVAHRFQTLWAQKRALEEENARYQRELEQRVAEKTAEVARLQHLRAQSEKMAALGTVVAGVAHEINNPLSVVLANLRWLSTAETDPNATFGERTDALAEAIHCGERMQRIVKDLRRVSHPMVAGACRVADALDEALLLARQHLPQTVTLDASVATHVFVASVAHDDLVTVVSNLVVNAIHAVEKRSEGRVRVLATADDLNVMIRVEDDGEGIPPEHLARIRDPFFTTKPPGRGTGLGLSLVDRIVHEVGGSLEIVSRVGEGTVISVTLPARAPQKAEPPLRARA